VELVALIVAGGLVGGSVGLGVAGGVFDHTLRQMPAPELEQVKAWLRSIGAGPLADLY
jgi:hypothetical protein